MTLKVSAKRVRSSAARNMIASGLALALIATGFIVSQESSASAAVLTPNGSTSTPPAPGKPCGNDLGLTVKFVPNKLDQSDTAAAVSNAPFVLTYTELSAPDPNQVVFGGVTSSVYGTDLLFTRVYLDTGNDGLQAGQFNNSYFDYPAVGDTLNPYGTGGINQILVCVALAFDLTKTVGAGVTGSHTYTFNVACSDNGNDPISFTRTITIDGAGSQTIAAPVPPGYDCVVTETHIDGQALPLATWLVTGSPATVDNVGSSSSVTITNSPATGKIKVVKSLTGPVLTGDPTSWAISLDCPGTAYDQTGSITVATPFLSNLIPVGTVCSVTETSNTTPYNVTYSGSVTVQAGVVDGSSGTTITVTNARKTGVYKITKVNTGGATTDEFTFSSTCEPTKTGATAIKITGSGTYTSDPLPTGTVCTIAETGGNTNYTTVLTPSDGVVTVGDTPVTVTVTNTAKGKIKVVKSLTGPVLTGDPTSWAISLDCPDTAYDQTGSITVATPFLSNLIPAGTVCSVTETSNTTPYNVTYSGSVTVQAGVVDGSSGTTITVTNARNTGSFDIVKINTGGTPSDQFTFRYTCGAAGEVSFNAAGSVSPGTVVRTVSGLATGTSCTVTEDANANYTTSVADDSATTTDGIVTIGSAKTTVTFTNTRRTGAFEIVKIRNGGVATDQFTFRYTCGTASEVSLTGTGSVSPGTVVGTVSGLPTGTTCTVTEDANALYTTSISDNSGTTTDGIVTIGDTKVTVTVTNTRNTAKLTLVKTVAGGTAAATSWVLTATGDATTDTRVLSGTSGINANVATGVYALTETGAVTNYVNGTTWNCGTAKGTVVTSVTLNTGDDVTCTITNKFVSIDIVKSIALGTSTTCPTTGYVDSLSPVLVGSFLCYQFVITNNGVADLSAVTLTDSRFTFGTTPGTVPVTCSVPHTLTSAGGLNLGPLVVSGTITCTAGPIAAVFGTGGSNVNTGTAVGCANITCTPSPTDTDTATYAPGYLGFTPGFWKNHTSANSNNAFLPRYIGSCMPPLQTASPWLTTIGTVFQSTGLVIETTGNDPKIGSGYPQGISLLTALGLRGGSGLTGANEILLRAATAAYLNACYSATLIPGAGAGAYPLTTLQVITQTVAALNSSDRNVKLTLATQLDLYNNTATHQIVW